MAKKPSRFERFVARPPALTVHSDEPLPAGDARLDSFDLRARVGPVYDILRHPKTTKPLAVAVYGDWGSGKSSAMRWLEGLLAEWRKLPEDRKPEGAIGVHSIWFEPWKYSAREDVWRGLIAEVILATVSLNDVSVPRVITAAKQFGLFLGRSFLHALGSIKIKAPGAEMSPGQAIQEIYKDWRQTARPEKAYLNEFEQALKDWVDDSLGPNERLAIFVDDLDRCLPEVALEVLEALKLYLNVPKVIFVVGVDPDVINSLVHQRYEKLHLKAEKNYLAKMFQVEVRVNVRHEQVHHFMDDLLKGADIWQKHLAKPHRKVLRDVLVSLVKGNPREAKRLVNDVMIYGASVLMAQDSAEQEASDQLFAQALQRGLLLRVLNRDHRAHVGLVDQRQGDRFFRHWSDVVKQNPDEPCYIPMAASLALGAEGRGAREETQEPAVGKARELPEKYRHFAPIWSAGEFAALRPLLGDGDIGCLMKIEYPADTEALSRAAPEVTFPQADEKADMAEVIRQAEAAARAGDPRFADPLAPLRDPGHDHWVRIPAGKFWMGAQAKDRSGPNYDPEAEDRESPVHEVALTRPYGIGRYPVTVCEYARFVDDGGYGQERLWPAGGFKEEDKPDDWEAQLEHPTRPVVSVSWYEACAYAAWATERLREAGQEGELRLPTEAEWERAARGTDGRKYPWGSGEPNDRLVNYGGNVGAPTPVGVYPLGATPEGICDMAGNVWEWCGDCFGAYSTEGTSDPTGPAEGDVRVLRGGSWISDARSVRSAYRYANLPGFRFGSIGFRLARGQ